MATVVAAQQATIEYRLNQMVKYMGCGADPVFKRFAPTSRNVIRNDRGQSRNYSVRHIFSEGNSGAMRWVTAEGPTVDNTTLTHGTLPNTPRTYPGLEDSILPGYFEATIPLTMGMGSMFMPAEFARMDRLDANVAKLVQDVYKGTGRMVSKQILAHWYRRGTVKSVIGTIADVATTATIKLRCGIKGVIQLLDLNTKVDVYDTTGVTKRNSAVSLVVDSVRFLPDASDAGYGEVTLAAVDGSDITGLGIIATDLITIWDSVGTGPENPFTWHIASGSVFGVNVSTYEQMQSAVISSFGDPDEIKVSRVLARLKKAYGMEGMPDTVLMSAGVELAMHDVGYGAGIRINRAMGDLSKLRMGGYRGDGEGTVYDGQKVEFAVSDYMPSDSAFSGTTNGGIMLYTKFGGGNIKLYLPPTLPFGQTQGGFGDDVGTIIELPFGEGTYGNWDKALDVNARKTEWLECNFNCHLAWAPDDMRGAVVTGVTEIL